MIVDSRNLKGEEPEGRTAILNEKSNEDTALPATQNTRDIRSVSKPYHNAHYSKDVHLNNQVSVECMHKEGMSSGQRMVMKNLQNLKRSKQQGKSAQQELAYVAHLSYGSHKT